MNEINIKNSPVFTVVEDDLQEKEHNNRAVIKVVGVGGGGGNAVSHMIEEGLTGVDFIIMNTDVQAFKYSNAEVQVQLGVELTKGLGAGANPQIGYQSAMENKAQIREALMGADIVFIAVGMGGGTGTGASPVVAQVANELGALTIGVVTKPSHFEGKKRMNYAEQGIKLIAKHIDSLLILPNDKLQKSLPKGVSFIDALKASNGVLYEAVAGFSAIINEEDGLINLDYADLRTINTGVGTTCVMGVGKATGDDRVSLAVKQAMSCPFLEEVDLSNIGRMLVHIVAGPDFSLEEYNLVGETLKVHYAEDAEVIIGVTTREAKDTGIELTLIATGLGDTGDPEKECSQFKSSGSTVEEHVAIATVKSEATQDRVDLETPAYLRKEKYVDIGRFIKSNSH